MECYFIRQFDKLSAPVLWIYHLCGKLRWGHWLWKWDLISGQQGLRSALTFASLSQQVQMIKWPFSWWGWVWRVMNVTQKAWNLTRVLLPSWLGTLPLTQIFNDWYLAMLSLYVLYVCRCCLPSHVGSLPTCTCALLGSTIRPFCGPELLLVHFCSL